MILYQQFTNTNFSKYACVPLSKRNFIQNMLQIEPVVSGQERFSAHLTFRDRNTHANVHLYEIGVISFVNNKVLQFCGTKVAMTFC